MYLLLLARYPLGLFGWKPNSLSATIFKNFLYETIHFVHHLIS
jgi:hypothetical protein